MSATQIRILGASPKSSFGFTTNEWYNKTKDQNIINKRISMIFFNYFNKYTAGKFVTCELLKKQYSSTKQDILCV